MTRSPDEEPGRASQAFVAVLVPKGVDAGQVRAVLRDHEPLALEEVDAPEGQRLVRATFSRSLDAIAAGTDAAHASFGSRAVAVASDEGTAFSLAHEQVSLPPDGPSIVLVQRQVYDRHAAVLRTMPLPKVVDAEAKVAVVGLRGVGPAAEAAPAEPKQERATWRERLEIVAAIAATAAGLVVWVTFVGGMTMWARLRAANLPELEAVSVLPRGVLEAEGIHVLVVTLGIALPVTVLAAIAWDQRDRSWGRIRGDARTAAVGVIAAIVLVVLTYWALGVHWWYVGWIIGVGVIAAVLVVGVLESLDDTLWRLVAAFAVVVVAAGFAGLFRELGSRTIRVDHAQVWTSDGEGSFDALFVARTADTLYLARKDSGDAHPACRLEVLATSAVRDLRIDDSHSQLCPAGTPDRGREAARTTTVHATTTIVTTTTTPAPTTTATVARGTVTIAPSTVTLPAQTVVRTVTTTHTTTTRQEVPAGGHPLGRGRWSIPISSVRPPLRLQISGPTYYPPEPLDNTRSFTVRLRITATRGYVVRGAAVYVRAIRSGYLRGRAQGLSDEDGYAYVSLQPTALLPFGRDVRVALFVRAWNPDESLVSATSQRRLVELRLAPRR